MALPFNLQNGRNLPVYSSFSNEFNQSMELGNWEWSYNGAHIPPLTLSDGDAGNLVLGSGSTTSQDYIQGQVVGASWNLGRLGKYYKALFTVQLSSATLCEAYFGVFATNTNLINTNITDGFGMYINGPAGPATGTWQLFNANGSTTQYTTYTPTQAGPAGDTLVHTYCLEVYTDPTTLGKGTIYMSQDGVQIGNGFSGTILTQQNLRFSLALGNGSGASQTMTVQQVFASDQR